MRTLWLLILVMFLFVAGCSQTTNKKYVQPVDPFGSTSAWPQDATCSPGCPAGTASSW